MEKNIILSGFDVFRTRNLENGINLSEQGNNLPPLYKLFISTFHIERNKLDINGCFLPQTKHVVGILQQVYLPMPDLLVVEDFLSISEGKIVMENAYGKDDSIHKEGYWPVAECALNIIMMVGTKQENLDQIFIENTSLFSDGSRYKFVSNNIFEFVRGMVFVEYDRIGYGIGGYGELYKKWGESFWRVG